MYKRAAENGNTDGRIEVAHCYRLGCGVRKNNRKAFNQYKNLVDSGVRRVLPDLAICYRDGEGTDHNPAECMRLCIDALGEGDPRIQHIMAYCYERGLGAEKSITQALTLYKMASDQGLEEASVAYNRINETWFVKSNSGNVRGPYRSWQMRLKLDSGEINEKTLISWQTNNQFDALWYYFSETINAFYCPGKKQKLMKWRKTSSVKMALSRAVIEPTWVKKIRKIVDGMSEVGWKASRAFNLFVISNVFSNKFEINTRKMLNQLTRLCYTINTRGKTRGKLWNNAQIVNWISEWDRLNPGEKRNTWETLSRIHQMHIPRQLKIILQMVFRTIT